MEEQDTESGLQPTLRAIQLRLSVTAGHTLTHDDLAHIAKVKSRSIGEWMRGGSSPASAQALLRLLSNLSAEEVTDVLKPWRSVSSIQKATGSSGGRTEGRSSPRSGKSRNNLRGKRR